MVSGSMEIGLARCASERYLLIFALICIQSSLGSESRRTTDLDNLKHIEQLREKERMRPILASEWISTDFGKDPSRRSSLHDTLIPASSPAFHRGAYLDNMLQMSGQISDAPEPQPAARSQVETTTISTLEGDYVVEAGPDASYLVSIYYPEQKYSNLWFSASLAKLYSALPEKAHVIFAVSNTTASAQQVLLDMSERCKNTSGYDSVKDRLHFMAQPLDLACTVDAFPNCHQTGQSWIPDAAGGWGSVGPTVTATWQDAEQVSSQMLEAGGFSGCLPPLTQVVKDNGGALQLPLVLWGGLACNISEHPDDDLAGKAVLIDRGECALLTKVDNAAAKGAKAVLIRTNNNEEELHEMSLGACGDSSVNIPAVMIRQEDGQRLADSVQGGAQVVVTLGAKLNGEHFLGVDHRGRLREVGAVSLGDERLDEAWRYLALEAVNYAYDQRVDHHLTTAAAAGIVLTVLDGADADGSIDRPFLGGGGGIYGDVTLPAAAAMQEYDTLEVAMELGCPGVWDRSCGAWDYVVQLQLCSLVDDTPASPAVGLVDGAPAGSHASCTVEMARWVTPYGRPGRWITDATAMLPLLRLGGRQHVTVSQPAWSGQRYRVSLSFLFSARGRAPGGAVPQHTAFLFPGGGLDAGYNSLPEHAPLQVHVPGDVTRAEVHAVVSGHGWGADSDNCAEFCSTEHRFSVRSGMDLAGRFYVSRRPGVYTHRLQRAGEEDGCAGQVWDGVTPNQYGTWRFGRAGWCPGGAVRPWVADVTRDVRAGLEGVVTYEALRNGVGYVPQACHGEECAPEGFPASIDLRSYLVLYAPVPSAPAGARATS